MTRKTPVKDVAASVHDRLLRMAKDSGVPFGEVLQYFAMERFLYRLSVSPQRDRFVLKGALMLRTWDAPLARPTMDIDLQGRMDNAASAVAAAIKNCLAVDVSQDGLSFDPESVEAQQIALDAAYTGVRVRFTGRLGERTRLVMQVDVGFGDPIVPGPVDIQFPVLLDFDPPMLLGYTPETTVAEKFQAMVELDLANSRMKDFYDLWMLAVTRQFDGATLARALAATFRNRRTPLPQTPPTALGPAFCGDEGKQIQWRAFLRRGRLGSASLAEVTAAVSRLVMPVSTVVAQGKPFAGTWVPGRGWTS